MRSLLAARSARLVLAAAAVAALTATTTACDADTSKAGSAASPASPAPVSSAPADASAPSAEADDSGSDSTTTGGSGTGGSTEKAVDTDAAKKKYYGQSCGTNDLTITVSEKTQAGGFFLVTAKAKPGITCELEGTIPNASFGSDPDTVASPAEQAVSGTVKLSGSTAAYAGINPKSTNTDGGKEFGLLIVAITGFEADAVELKVPGTVVDKPITTNWHAKAADAVPFAG